MNSDIATTTRQLERYKEILGIPVGSITLADGIAHLAHLVRERQFARIGFVNVHSANTAFANPEFASALEQFLLLPDGAGMDIAARILYGQPFPDNLNGTDFIPAFLIALEEPITVGLFGATGTTADRAALAFSRIAPQHRYVAISNGYFRPEDEAELLERIASLQPEVLLVALGVPGQELWIERNLSNKHCLLPIAVGALLDFYGGNVRRAPQWVRNIRLEWVYRLLLEPARLWRRYIVGNPVFLTRIGMQKLTGRSRKI